MPTNRYYTSFTQPDGLAEGAPVYNMGLPVGSVTQVSPNSGGGAGVAFDVYPSAAGEIRQDSIMVLRDDPKGPSLDVMSPNPSSAMAASGATIDGALSQADANSIVAAKNLAAMAPAVAMMMSTPASSAASPAASPAWLQLQQQIAMLQLQYLASGMTNAANAAQQLRSINNSAAALERQLIAAGHSAEAERLRRKVENLSHTLTSPPGSVAPYGATPPSGAPSTSSKGSTLEIPPAH